MSATTIIKVTENIIFTLRTSNSDRMIILNV